MKNRLFMIAMAVMIAVAGLLSGCSSSEPELVPVNVNATDQTNTTRQVLGKEALIELGSGLWYDSVTGIIYWWNGIISTYSYSATVPTPYYAPNGLPYRYNPETNTFEEIER